MNLIPFFETAVAALNRNKSAELGDRSQYIDHVFRMRWVEGDPYPADGENTEAAWFPLDARPPMSEEMTGRIEAALSERPSAHFRWAGEAREG